MVLPILFLLIGLPSCIAAKDILDYGAIPNANGYDFYACLSNGKALFNAVIAASGDPNDRVVLIPAGNFSFLPYGVFDGLHNITIILDGTLNLWEGNISEWTKVDPKYRYHKSGSLMNVITFFNSTFITMTSTFKRGIIVGNGWRWWVAFVLKPLTVDRPMILLMVNCNYTVVEGWDIRNSPFANLYFDTIYHAVFQNISIHVDWRSQAKLLAAHNKISDTGIPFFPINTGGIQVSGANITSRNCYIEMFDDAYAVKTLTAKQGCSRDMVFEDATIVQGVGASIGTVPGSFDVNCIRNITFRRISFHFPIKAIYVKYQPCDPATDGTGFIDDVTYEDIYADTPTQWGIYVGTQQQDEGNANTGCSFLYPMLPGAKCPTYPCISITNLKLKNVYMKNALFSPGMMRCNEANPCRGWEWTNVTLTSATNFPFGNNFLCEALLDTKFVNVTQSCVTKGL